MGNLAGGEDSERFDSAKLTMHARSGLGGAALPSESSCTRAIWDAAQKVEAAGYA